MPRSLRESRHVGAAHGGGGIHKALTGLLARGVSAYGLVLKWLGQPSASVSLESFRAESSHFYDYSVKQARSLVWLFLRIRAA